MEAICCLCYSTPLVLYVETQVQQLKGLHSGENGQPFAVITSSGQTHEYYENGFNLGGAGRKIPERITAKDLRNNIVKSIAYGLSKQNSLSKKKLADHAT
ncbi:hypothetical protein HAX54_033627 [Datura stramonium]|uniref:Uncharacterized protein n=1 Tax=Datura stramonium TaxID=4076 RepID=A0ABS8VDS0_DATST|nr:hypothetical protein [Datura stramonium]